MIKNILLPIDHTDPKSWQKALPFALEQAKFYDAKLTSIEVFQHVLHLPNLPANYGDGAKDYVQGKIREILDGNGAKHVPVDIEEGSIYREILKYAHANDIDMIIMASAKGDFPNYEIGPNLARVVRNAHCSVVVVRD